MQVFFEEGLDGLFEVFCIQELVGFLADFDLHEGKQRLICVGLDIDVLCAVDDHLDNGLFFGGDGSFYTFPFFFREFSLG
jgi:hypothetical protein